MAAKVQPTPQKKPKKPSTVSKKKASPRGKAKAVPKAKAKASTQVKGTRKSKASPKAKGKAAASRVAKSKAAPKKKAVAKKEKDSIQKKLHCAPGWQQVCETLIVKNCEQSFHFLSSASLAPDLEVYCAAYTKAKTDGKTLKEARAEGNEARKKHPGCSS